MKKYLLFALMAGLLCSCNNNEPTSKYVGVWEPIGEGGADLFVISADSIKAVSCYNGSESYQSHYEMISNGVAKLERCWLEDMAKNHDLSQGDWNPEQYFFDEAQMYIDKDGYLNIDPYDIPDYLSQKVPNYSRLKLKRYEKN